MNVHKSICPVIKQYNSWSKVRKFLKFFGLTRTEQKQVIDICQWETKK